MTNEHTALLRKAHDIALSSLRSCYSQEGIFAGLHQFSDYWARDSLFSSWGALAIGDSGIVRKNLSLLLRNQRANGQIPLRVGDYFIGLKVLGINLKQSLKPRYSQDKDFSCPTDQNSLLIITANNREIEKNLFTLDRCHVMHCLDLLKIVLVPLKPGTPRKNVRYHDLKYIAIIYICQSVLVGNARYQPEPDLSAIGCMPLVCHS